MRGELDWIVMKALEKDRNRRYETASALRGRRAALLERRAGAGLSAHGLRYRLGKFAQNIRVLLTLASTVVTFLLVGIAGLSTAVVLVTNARSKTDAALTAEQQAQAQTHGLLGYSTDAIGTLVAKQPHLGAEERAILGELLLQYEKAAGNWGDNEKAHEIAAEGQSNVRIHELLGDPPPPKPAMKRRLRVCRAGRPGSRRAGLSR